MAPGLPSPPNLGNCWLVGQTWHVWGTLVSYVPFHPGLFESRWPWGPPLWPCAIEASGMNEGMKGCFPDRASSFLFLSFQGFSWSSCKELGNSINFNISLSLISHFFKVQAKMGPTFQVPRFRSPKIPMYFICFFFPFFFFFSSFFLIAVLLHYF